MRCSRMKRPYEAVYNQLTYTATTKGHSVSLTYEEYLKFTEIHTCHYCGSHIEWLRFTTRDAKGYSIDRKDNAIGYTFDNCVPCCYICNKMKGKMDYYEFMEQCQKITDTHQQSVCCSQAPLPSYT